jgi:2-iminobutanoate/2-iminopropanoate deaminase
MIKTFKVLKIMIFRTSKGEKMTIQTIYTKKAPLPIGPYSQAIVAGDYVFISGQIGLDPDTGKLAEGGIKEQTNQVIDNIESILISMGLKLKSIVKTEVYLTNLDEFREMNEVYARRFVYDIKPARATVQVAKLPLDAKIEIASVAYLGDKNV